MGLEASKFEARQAALDTTVTDLVRIVGKLDKKIDTGFKEQGIRLDSLETRMESVETRIGSLETRIDSFEVELKSDIAELKSMLTVIASKLMIN